MLATELTWQKFRGTCYSTGRGPCPGLCSGHIQPCRDLCHGRVRGLGPGLGPCRAHSRYRGSRDRAEADNPGLGPAHNRLDPGRASLGRRHGDCPPQHPPALELR